MTVRIIIIVSTLAVSMSLFSQNAYQWATETRIQATSNVQFLGVLKSGLFITRSNVDNSVSISDDEGKNWKNVGKLNMGKFGIKNFIESRSKDTLYHMSSENDVFLIDIKLGKSSRFYTSKKPFSDVFMTQDGNLLVLAQDSIILINNKAEVVRTIKNTFGSSLIGFPIENGKLMILSESKKTLSLLNENLNIISNNNPIDNINYFKNNIWVSQPDQIYAIYDNKLQISVDSCRSFRVLEGQETISLLFDRFFVNTGETALGFGFSNKFYFYDLLSGNWQIADNDNPSSELAYFGDKIVTYDENNVYTGDQNNNNKKAISLTFGATNVSKIQAFENDFFYFVTESQKGIFDKGEIHPIDFLVPYEFLYMDNGSLQMSNYDSIYLTLNRGKSFTSYRPNFFNSGNRLTRDLKNKLYFFTSTDFFTSIDNAVSWVKEDKENYFPPFSAIKRDVKPHHSGNHFGRSDITNLIRYNRNTDEITIHFNVNYVQQTFHHFAILPDMTALCFIENKSDKKQTLYRKSGTTGATSGVNFPVRPANNTFATDEEGIIYIHDGKNILTSLDRGNSWINITGDLPDDIVINDLAVGRDKTIYLACKGSYVRKSLFKIIKTNQLVLETYRLNLACDSLLDDRPTSIVNYKIDNKIFTGNSIGGTTYIYLPDEFNGKKVEVSNFNNKVYAPCQDSLTIPYGEGQKKIHFFLKELKSCADVSVKISTPFLRRCFSVPILGRVSNTGSKIAQNTYVIIHLDSLLVFESASHPVEFLDDRTIKMYLGDLKAQENLSFNMIVHVGCQASFTELLCFDATVYSNDLCEPIAQKDSLCTFPIGSFDPNDIQAYANGRNTVDYVEKNDNIRYRIRFQNTGTDTAFNVYITDTLPQELNARSVRPIIASHEYTWELRDNILLLKFENIYLPDSNKNEMLSNGFIDFSIEMSEDIANGDRINNYADIYFDFNLPVRTNTSSLIVGKPSSTVEDLMERLHVFPNPAQEVLYIQIKAPMLVERVSILDMNGRPVKTLPVNAQSGTNVKVEINDLPSGMYILQIRDDQGKNFHKKFLKL